MPISIRWRTLLLCLFVAVIWFGNLQYRDLFLTDEGRYAEIPREMVARGDWVTPHLDGFKYLEKPPLHYWITAGIYTVAGEHNWTARLWIALAGFLGLGMTWYAGRRLFDDRTGRYSALALAGSFYYVFLAHFNTLDMGLALFMCASLFAFLIAQSRPEDRVHTRGWMLAAWAAAALALLTKGLIAIAIPGLVFVLYSLTKRNFAIWKRLHILPGLAVFLAISAPWYILVSMRNDDFLHFFFVVQHFERYLTPIADRSEPWYYFIPVLGLGALPWLWQAALGLVRAVKRGLARDTGQLDTSWFLWLWVIATLVFFSISNSKLASYLIPVMPAFALLIGRELAQHERKGLVSALALTALIGVAIAVYSGFYLPSLTDDYPRALYVAFSHWLIAAGVLLVLVAVAGLVLFRGRPAAIVVLLALGWLVATQVMMSGEQALSPVYSTRALAAELKDINTSGVPFYSVEDYQQSLPFYLRRTVTPVAWYGELEFGITHRQKRQSYVPNWSKFKQRWREDKRAYAYMSRETYHKLRQSGLPMRVVAQDPRQLIVTKP